MECAMATKQQRLQNQDALAQALPAVATQIMAILPKVVKWGVGLKEVNGVPTDQFCLRVYVQKLKTDPVVNVQPVIQGYPTEVVQMYLATSPPPENPKGEETMRKDETEHRPVKGGIALSTKSLTKDSKEGPESGTLGWFVKTLPGNSILALTNAHVLWPNLDDTKLPGLLKGPDPLAQPIYDKTCCCEYHVCGDRIIGMKNADVDCGIASLNADAGTPALIIGNNSTDLTLRVDGSAKAAIGDKVRKIGKRSGYTEGIVIDVGAFPKGTLISPPTIPGGTIRGTIESRVNKILIWPTIGPGFTPYFDEIAPSQVAFSNEGDSGSAVIDEDNNIVGLIYSRDAMSVKRSVGIACHIEPVLKTLNDSLKAEAVNDQKYNFQIELLKSPPGGQNSGIAADFRLPHALTLNDLIRESDTLLGALVRRHRDEVSHLINHCRPVTVVWHRHHGPAFAAAVKRNHREPVYRVPREINGIGRHELLVAIARALEQHGSAVLQEDLREHGLALIDDLCQTDNIRAILFPAAEATPVAQPV
jgi:hypothetical protein